MATDRYKKTGVLRKNPTEPSPDAFVISPGAAALAEVTRSLYVGTAGDVQVTFLGIDSTNPGATLVIPGVPAGTILPIRVTHVLAGGTTASGLIGLV